MDSETFTAPKKPVKCYTNKNIQQKQTVKVPKVDTPENVPCTPKKAVEFLLEGTLKTKLCRYCLNITSSLSDLGQIVEIASNGFIYSVTIEEMVASFHPVKVVEDPNLPNSICDVCFDKTVKSYLFSQQCEQSERALRNCLSDIYDKLEKLDPLQKTRTRGRQKIHINHNILYTEHEKVIDYAQPIMHLVSTNASSITDNNKEINKYECLKCWQVLPDYESLANHEKIHPNTMWFSCRLCGKSFQKRYHIKRHIRNRHSQSKNIPPEIQNGSFKCYRCGFTTNNYHEFQQHVENHKFKKVLEHIIEGKMDDLCTVCYENDGKMVGLNEEVLMHGGYPDLSGKKSMFEILGSTLPEMSFFHNYTGTKVCDKCYNLALTSFIFISKAYFIKNRLSRCVSAMLDNLVNESVGASSNVYLEISQQFILPEKKHDDLLDYWLNYDEEDVSKLKVDILEDEFRIESEGDNESETEIGEETKSEINPVLASKQANNSLLKEERTRNLVNGYHNNANEFCNEFLTFNIKKKPHRKDVKARYQCPLCSKNFITAFFLKRHILKHLNKKVTCKICNSVFKSKFYLLEHTKIVHKMNLHSYHSCKVCGRTFDDVIKMTNHVTLHLTKECQLCDKKFVSQKHYDSHMQRHALKYNLTKPKYTESCSICEKSYANDNDLALHVNKTHLLIKPYSCDMCSKTFYTEHNLTQHKKLHNVLAKETCVFCNKTMKSRSAMVVHIRKHIGVKPHFCNICQLSFYSESAVKKHMTTTHGGRFSCKFCRTVFSTKFDLKTHVIKTHLSL